MDARQDSVHRLEAASQNAPDQDGPDEEAQDFRKSMTKTTKEADEKHEALASKIDPVIERSWKKEQRAKNLKDCEDQLSALEQTLQNRLEYVEQSIQRHSDTESCQHHADTGAHEEKLQALNSEWKKRWAEREEEAAAQIKTLQELLEAARKLKPLEDQVRCERAAKEACLQRGQELQYRKVKEEPCSELFSELCKMEQQIKLLAQQRAELQEIFQRINNRKAQRKKEEEKAKKVAENRLEEEMEMEQLKKEKKENGEE